MSSTTVTKIFTFDSAHRLSNYQGQCFRLHGHTYKLEITFEGKIQTNGMVMDFSEIKSIFEKRIQPSFDHKLILYKKDELNTKISKNFPKDWVTWVDYNPTAENMANDIKTIIVKSLNNSSINLVSVTLWETPTSYAKVCIKSDA
jgi:6-pyruvoyltetrahydropterin/6-carboxytetrahydropterin synthase